MNSWLVGADGDGGMKPHCEKAACCLICGAKGVDDNATGKTHICDIIKCSDKN